MKLYLQLSMEKGMIDICPCKVEHVETICRAEFNSLLGNPELGTQWALEGDPRFRERFEDVYRGVMVLNASDEQGVFVYNAGEQFAYLPNAKALMKETVDKNPSREWPFRGVRFHQILKMSQDILAIINGYLSADSPEKYQERTTPSSIPSSFPMESRWTSNAAAVRMSRRGQRRCCLTAKAMSSLLQKYAENIWACGSWTMEMSFIP